MKLRNKKTGAIGHLLTTKGLNSYDIISSNYELLIRYKSLAELNESWEECYKADPLIKDEEVRTIVKLWAKYHNADKLRYLELKGIRGHYLKAGLYTIDIDVETLKVGLYYTVEELCGEEE